MILAEAKEIVLQREKERLQDNKRIFYPDPCNTNDCAQCGKAKELHFPDFQGKPFFCNSLKKKGHDELMDEAAELYAQWRAENGFILGNLKRENIEKAAEEYTSQFAISDSTFTEKGKEKVKKWGKQDFMAGAMWVVIQIKNMKSEKIICPKCENPYPHSHSDGHNSCEECGHKFN